MPVYDEVVAQIADTPPITTALSPESAVLIRAAYDYLIRVKDFWSKADGDDFTPAEIDNIHAWIGTLYKETSVGLLGIPFPYITTNPPIGSLPCDGSSYSRSDYPALYDALDPAFIIDSSSFRVPDMRGRVILGAGTGTGLSTYIVNEQGGEESHQLVIAEMPSHDHTASAPTVTDAGHVHTDVPAIPNITTIGAGAPQPTAVPGVGSTGIGFANISATAPTISPTGGDGGHENRQPFVALKFAVWAR